MSGKLQTARATFRTADARLTTTRGGNEKWMWFCANASVRRTSSLVTALVEAQKDVIWSGRLADAGPAAAGDVTASTPSDTVTALHVNRRPRIRTLSSE